MAKQTESKKEKKSVSNAIVHIGATFNNTMITLTDLEGRVLCWGSAGKMGFKGSRKSTPYAAKLIGESVMEKANDFSVNSIEIRIKGLGSGRESALRAIATCGLRVTKITDVTPLAHNGCRPPKRRRI